MSPCGRRAAKCRQRRPPRRRRPRPRHPRPLAGRRRRRSSSARPNGKTSSPRRGALPRLPPRPRATMRCGPGRDGDGVRDMAQAVKCRRTNRHACANFWLRQRSSSSRSAVCRSHGMSFRTAGPPRTLRRRGNVRRRRSFNPRKIRMRHSRKAGRRYRCRWSRRFRARPPMRHRLEAPAAIHRKILRPSRQPQHRR